MIGNSIGTSIQIKHLNFNLRGKMDIQIIIVGFIGIGSGLLQGIIILYLKDIKKTQDVIWKRLNSHYHEVHCDNDECKHLRTGNVVIPVGS